MQRLLLTLAAACAVASTGCSTVGGLFGFTPPAYKLTDETVFLRDAQSAAPAPIPKETRKALLAPYVVEPGDTLLIQPADLDSPIRLPGDQVVLPDGTIELGRYGRPVVAGKAVAQIEAEVRQLVLNTVRQTDRDLARSIEQDPSKAPVLTVRIVGRASKVYYVLGEVNAPGAFPLSGRETVLDGIIAAGNLTRTASHKNVVLARPTSPEGCRVVLPICLDDIMQQADPNTNYQLQPGDRIFVGSKTFREDFQLPFGKPKGECPPCDRLSSPCPLGQCPSVAPEPAAPTAAPVLPAPTPMLPPMGPAS